MKKLFYISLSFISILYFSNYGMEQQLQINSRFATTDIQLNKQSKKNEIEVYLNRSREKTKNQISVIQGILPVHKEKIDNLEENKNLTQAMIHATKNSNNAVLSNNQFTQVGNNLIKNIIQIAQLSKKINLNNNDKIVIVDLKNSPLFDQTNINLLSHKINWDAFEEACITLHNVIPEFPIPQTIKSAIATIDNERKQSLLIAEGAEKHLSDAAKIVMDRIIFIANNIDNSDDKDKKLIVQLKNHPLLQQKDASKFSLTLYDPNTKELLQTYTQWPHFEAACKTINQYILDFPIPYVLNLQGMQKLKNDIENQKAVLSGKLSIDDAFKQLDLYFPKNIQALQKMRSGLEEAILKQEEENIIQAEEEIALFEEKKEIQKEEEELKKEERKFEESRKKKEIEQKVQEFINIDKQQLLSQQNKLQLKEEISEKNKEEMEVKEAKEQSPEKIPSLLQQATNAIRSTIYAIYNTIKFWLSWLWS